MRLDVALVARGLARSRNQAAALIADGHVTVEGVVVRKASHVVGEDDAVHAQGGQWVSRAAHKLLGALDESGTDVPARVLDAGASTGGFTQVCLSRGAERVYAVDVGHGQLAPELREDPRVVVREGLNVRGITLADVDDEPVDLVVGDLSFISLRLVLMPLLAVCRGVALLLVKPQFEVGPGVTSGGIVTDPAARESAVSAVVEAAARSGWACTWRGASPMPGQHGNVEYFVRLQPAPIAGQ
ncbi:MAG: TlyA family RNA methyltransferase [Propionibacterium sp.]|nr:TlyA family RNA methyltransferase [Propionibacterium sp.]